MNNTYMIVLHMRRIKLFH